MQTGVILIGEPLGLLIAQNEGPLESVTGYSLAVAGAEFNVAVGLSRLEQNVTYMTRLGTDPFGRLIKNTMNENNIGTEFIIETDEQTTGFMLKSRTSKGDPDIYYYRRNSAASMLSRDDIDKINLDDYSILHLTGILPALSDSTREAVFSLLERARRTGLKISFDPNLRPQLWPDTKTMVETLNRIAAYADIVMPGENEGEILCGTKDPERISTFYHKLGVPAVVVKTGSRGAYLSYNGDHAAVPGFPVKKVVDTVGAGDGFAVGLLSALLDGHSLNDAVERGNAVGAIQVMNPGDNNGLPTRDELKNFMGRDVL